MTPGLIGCQIHGSVTTTAISRRAGRWGADRVHVTCKRKGRGRGEGWRLWEGHRGRWGRRGRREIRRNEKKNNKTQWPSVIDIGASNTSGGYKGYMKHELAICRLRMFSCEVPWTFYCKMVEIPQKIQESNFRFTKIRLQTPPCTPLDKIQTFN